ncbi:hypothetical protein ACJMK2_018549 [Sinanodonta woodiana]|uniref:Uncharacterized protein n=1 Tax=Sinanodonta woodiana TaxID=1069815 RepID=A0ABD3UFA1_SINWO
MSSATISKSSSMEDLSPVSPRNMMDELKEILLERFGPINQKPELVERLPAELSVQATVSIASSGDSIIKPTDPLILSKENVTERNVMIRPIIFKTSVKKDKGSKLHDALVTELTSVLQKRNAGGVLNTGENNKDKYKISGKKKAYLKRGASAKGDNNVFANKGLLASLENHLLHTLHKHSIFQKQRLQVNGIQTFELPSKTEDSQNKASVSVDKDRFDGQSIKALEYTKEGVGLCQTVQSDTTASSHNRDVDSDTSQKDDQQLIVYAYKQLNGLTEGVVCSIRVKPCIRSGLPKKYVTCIKVQGCPFKQEISDGGLPTASGDGLYYGQENKISTFHVDVGRRKGNLQVSVDGPNSIAKCNVDPQPNGNYTITYIPVETGMFDVSVKWNGEEIPGSPYHPRIVDPTKVKIIGGWNQFYDANERISLTVGEVKVLPFDTSEAGPGKLRADVSGPGGKISSHVDEQSGGRTLVKFTPEDEGNHYIRLFWSDLPLPNSPYHGYAVPVAMDANKVILTGRGLKEAIIREEAEFVIDGSQAGKGSPEVTLTGVRAEVSVKVISLGNGRYRCHYIPIVPGAYLLHISWNGRQLRGSPYKVNIIGAFFPNKVTVSGDGLQSGIMGKEQNILIDTRRAGPGELTAHCMGPHVVAFCELEDRRDGTFRLGIRPQEPGRHVLQIKYGGEHVTGSPFAFKVMQQPDAGRVRVTGPGVEHGILANFQSRFTVETRGAGAGQLTVRIRGPKGAFQVEMYRDSQRDRTILCRYDPVETGLYIISVKWSGVDVPGSPFQVHLVDTQQELEQVYNDQAYTVPLHSNKASLRAPQPMNYAQWREEL